MSRVLSITSSTEFDVATRETLCVILYMIPHCPHCLRFSPGFNSVSIERSFSNVAFHQINLAAGEGLQIARRNNVGGVPHVVFYSRGRKLGEMRGDNIAEFRKQLTRHQTERTWSGEGHMLGSRPGGVEPPRAMGGSRSANADALQELAVSQEKVGVQQQNITSFHFLTLLSVPTDERVALFKITEGLANKLKSQLPPVQASSVAKL